MPFNLPNNYLLYFTSTEITVKDDACSPLPASTPDLSNRVVVVQRGTCNFVVKQQNVAAAGGCVRSLSSWPAPLIPVRSSSQQDPPHLQQPGRTLDPRARRWDDGLDGRRKPALPGRLEGAFDFVYPRS